MLSDTSYIFQLSFSPHNPRINAEIFHIDMFIIPPVHDSVRSIVIAITTGSHIVPHHRDTYELYDFWMM